jgi:hypothetical protein
MAESAEGRHWLVEPPAPKNVNFDISSGDQVQITPEVQEAFEHLVRALHGDDVQGYVAPSSPNPLCAIDFHCAIAITPGPYCLWNCPQAMKV